MWLVRKECWTIPERSGDRGKLRREKIGESGKHSNVEILFEYRRRCYDKSPVIDRLYKQ